MSVLDIKAVTKQFGPAVRAVDNFSLPVADGELVCLSGCDPLNLVGTVLVGDKVPALAGSRVLYRDGVAIAALVGGKPTALIELSAADTQLAKHALLRHPPSLPEMPAAAR